MDSQTLVSQLCTIGLLPEEEGVRQELLRLQQLLPDARALSRELLGRDLLTPYQANQLLMGKGQALVLGPYRVLERLGEGGMAQVFKARHSRLHRLAALKVIRPERLGNRVTVERFLREAQAVAPLSHPNIVRAYDAGHEGETYFFAMEFINGMDLARLVLKEGPLGVDQACEYTRQAALGLEHIHEHGMVHRDVKPGNLMVTRVRSEGADLPVLVRPEGPSRADAADFDHAPLPTHQIKILDLGLARLAEEPNGADQREALTRLGTVVGTPDYMAPEQALHSRNADIRSDIYSLGCTLYFLLAGRPPFPGGTAVEKMLKHQIEEPTPIQLLRQDVPIEVSQALVRMMAKDPDRRYQIPGEAALALQAALNNRPAIAVPVQPLADPEAETVLHAPPPRLPNPPTESLPLGLSFPEEFRWAEVYASPGIIKPPPPSPPEWSLWIVLACVGVVAGLGILGALFAVFR